MQQQEPEEASVDQPPVDVASLPPDNQKLIQNLDAEGERYFKEIQKAATNLVDMKVAVHEHDAILDHKIDGFRVKIGVCEANTEVIEKENRKIESFINVNRAN